MRGKYCFYFKRFWATDIMITFLIKYVRFESQNYRLCINMDKELLYVYLKDTCISGWRERKDSVCNCIRYFYAPVINHEIKWPLLHRQILQAVIMTMSHGDNTEIDCYVWQLCWAQNTAFKIRPVFPFRLKMCLKLSMWMSIWYDTCRFIMKNKWTVTYPF